MPTPVLASVLAVALAAIVAVATPALLRWCPAPPEEPHLAPFSDLASRRFRVAVFVAAAVGGGVAFLLTPAGHWAAWAPLAGLGALLGLVDLRTTYLPLRLNYLAIGLALAGVGVAAASDASWQPLVGGVAGGLGAAALFWLVWWVSGGRLGFGDVRLAGLIGLVAGTGGLALLFWSLLLGTAAGAVWAVVLRVRRGVDTEFPYGPALLLGPFLALCLRAVLPG